MTLQRYVYASILFALSILAGATSAGLLSAHWAAWAGVLGAALTGTLTILTPKQAPQAKAALPPEGLGPFATLCLFALVLASCSASQQKAETQAGPDCLRCAIEVVPIFTVTRDAGTKAPDAGGDAK